MRLAAQQLGLDPVRDEQLMWVAEHAAHVELPDEWTEFDDEEGEKAYYHPKTKKLTRQHPVMAKYAKFLAKIREFQDRKKTKDLKVRPHLAVVLNEVLNRVNRELPPATPDIIERLAVLLNIDSVVDHGLTRRLKIATDNYAEEQYDLAIMADRAMDLEGFLTEIRDQQVAVEVLDKPEEVIMCSEIPGEPARVKCDQCKDFFCLQGFAKTHSRGKRQNHTTVKCEQTTCSVYPNQLATCEVDSILFCDRGYAEKAETNPSLRQKRKKILGGLACSEYPGRRAEVLCEEMSDLFCWEAFIELHRRGNRARHIPLTLDEHGLLYRAGELCPAEETARLIDKARIAREGGIWLAFEDDQLNTFWYNLADKLTTQVNPYL